MTSLAEPRTLPAASGALDAMGSLKQYLAGRPVIITIDGPAAVGKGTVSKMLARRGGAPDPGHGQDVPRGDARGDG